MMLSWFKQVQGGLGKILRDPTLPLLRVWTGAVPVSGTCPQWSGIAILPL